jgi:hypothetical protein
MELGCGLTSVMATEEKITKNEPSLKTFKEKKQSLPHSGTKCAPSSTSPRSAPLSSIYNPTEGWTFPLLAQIHPQHPLRFT